MGPRTVILAFATCSIWWMSISTSSAQPALERLERQIRQRVGTPDSAEPAGKDQPAARQPTPARRENAAAAYLGVVVDDRRDRGRGVRIVNVHTGSPAEKAGLLRQDLIVSVAGIRVRQLSDLNDMLEMCRPGQGVEFEVLRNGQSQKSRVVLGQRPAAAAPGPQSVEAVPPPQGEPIPAPPEPGAGPQLQPAPPEAARVERLEQRIKELERRVDELERELKTIKKGATSK
jgi:hypothetical protein